MIGQYLMYAAGYTLAAMMALGGVRMIGIGYIEDFAPGYIVGAPTLCLGLLLAGACAYHQFPPIVEACK